MMTQTFVDRRKEELINTLYECFDKWQGLRNKMFDHALELLKKYERGEETKK